MISCFNFQQTVFGKYRLSFRRLRHNGVIFQTRKFRFHLLPATNIDTEKVRPSGRYLLPWLYFNYSQKNALICNTLHLKCIFSFLEPVSSAKDSRDVFHTIIHGWHINASSPAWVLRSYITQICIGW